MSNRLSIKPEELKDRLDNNKVKFLLDLRNEDEFESWRIESCFEMESVNIPQIDFVGEEERHFNRFPRDKQMIVVCAHGDSSKYTAELLQKEGFDALNLEGGMDLWSEYYQKNTVSDDPLIYQFNRISRGCLSYLILSDGAAVVIDAPRHLDHIIELIESERLHLAYVFDTHLQADHISGGRALAEKTGCSYYINLSDGKGAGYDFVPLEDGMKVTFGKSGIKVVHSPGHTPGSTSLLLDNRYLFTGDTIMKASIGRPDLGGAADSWSIMLYNTLFERFADFDDDIVILPSHSSSICEEDENHIIKLTLGEARNQRDLFKIRDQRAFTEKIKSTLLDNPSRYQDIRMVNLGTLKPEEKKQKELEIGKNLCGMKTAESDKR